MGPVDQEGPRQGELETPKFDRKICDVLRMFSNGIQLRLPGKHPVKTLIYINFIPPKPALVAKVLEESSNRVQW